MNTHRKKVLFLTYNFPPKLGGQEQVIWEVWKRLSERSDATALVQHGADFEGDRSIILPAPRSGLLAFFRHLLAEGGRLQRSEGFDVIIAANGLTAWPVQRLASKSRCESAAILYGLDTIYPGFVYQRMIRSTLPKLDRAIAISHATASEAINRGMREERLCVLPPGCNADPFLIPQDLPGLRKKWGTENLPVILHTGRLVPRKGMDRFLREVFPRVLAKIPNANLLLAGGNPEGALAHQTDESTKIHKTIEALGFGQSVRVTGRLSDTEKVETFAIADLFVMPAVPTPGDMEGFGIVLLEAAAAGMPTVATRLGGIPDAVEDGVTGFLVDPHDYEKMAERIVELLSDREKARDMGEAGRARVLENYRWNQVADRYVDFLLGELDEGDPLP